MTKKLVEEKLNNLLDYINIDPDIKIEEKDSNYEIIISGDDLSCSTFENTVLIQLSAADGLSRAI